ncbi:MAG: hypothetical protein RI963_393 [Planctomycetota bacterium]|jgi:preprotein translocase subunit YajC
MPLPSLRLRPLLGDGDLWQGILAQVEGGEATPLTPLQQFLQGPWLLLGGMLALFYFIVLVPERRRKAERAAQLAAIQKNDRIVTIGGIHGVVSAINEGNTLTIRLDESGNNKMKIDREAIARIVTDKPKEE